MFNTVHVTGEKRHEVYKYLMKCTSDNDIRWNFSTAFVVRHDGCVSSRIDQPDENDWSRVKEEIDNCFEVKSRMIRGELKED